MDLAEISDEQLQATFDARVQEQRQQAAEAPLPDKDNLADLSDEQLQAAILGHQRRNEQILAPVRKQVESEGVSEGVGPYLGRAFISPIRGPLTAAAYAYSKNRLNSGDYDEGDLRNIALYEREQRIGQEQSEGTKWAGVAAAAPGQIATLGFGGAGGLALKAATIGGGAIAGAAADQGTAPWDPNAVLKGGATAGAQLALLHGLGPLAEKVFPGAQSVVGRAAATGAAGTASMAVTDYATKIVGLTEHGGAIGDLIDGKYGDAARNAAGNFIMTAGLGAADAVRKGISQKAAVDRYVEQTKLQAEAYAKSFEEKPPQGTQAPVGEKAAPEPPYKEQWPQERVEEMRQALTAVGMNAKKWSPEKVQAEAKRLGIDKATEQAPQPPVQPVASQPEGVASQPPVERRVDLARRARVAEMTPEEMKRELLTSKLTGLANRRAYEESERKAHQSFADADGLKQLNDRFGHEAGDALLKAVGEAFQKEGVPAFHLSGDEFAHEHNDPAALKADMERVQKRLNDYELTFQDPQGRLYVKKGIGLSFGTGESLAKAESEAGNVKVQREKAGGRELRSEWEGRFKADRGALPRGVSEVPAQGNETGPNRVAGAESPARAPVAEAGGAGGLKGEQQRVADNLWETGGYATAGKVQKLLGISRSKAAAVLNDLAAAKVLKRTGDDTFELHPDYVTQRKGAAQPAASAVPVTAASRSGILDRIDRGDGGLSPAEANVLRERVMWGTGFREIAKKQGIAFQTAANLEKSALKKLGYTGSAAQLHGKEQAERPTFQQSKGRAGEPEFSPRAPAEENVHEFNPESRNLAGVSGQPETTYGDPRLTALANAKVAEERVARGQEPIPQSFKVSHPEAANMAEAALRENPNAAVELVDTLDTKPRPTSIGENALLLYRMVQLKGDVGREVGRRSILSRTPEQAAIHQQRINGLLSELDRVERVSEKVGGEAGGAFNFRKQLIDESYDLAGMLQKARAAKGSDLTEQETAKITELQEKIAALEKKLDEANTADNRIDVKRAKREYTETVTKLRDSNLSTPRKVFRGGMEILDAARAIITSVDLSAVFKQGGMFTFGHPLKAAKAFPEMLRAFASERNADRVWDAIQQRPNAPWYKKSGLYLADPEARLSGQEEAYIGKLVKKIPLVAGSERAYSTFLNRIRADLFDALAGSMGENGRVSDPEAKVLANYVNASTGRGNLFALENAAVPLARVFFSPRFVASRLQILSGEPLWRGNATTRKLIAGEYARFAAGVGLFYAAAKLAGQDDVSIEGDPRSSDFGKVKIGRTRIDPLAGLQQYGVFGARMATGDTKQLNTGKVQPIRGPKVQYGQSETIDVITRFGRSKLAPVPGAALDVVTGKDYAGQPTSAVDTGRKLATPIAVQDVWDAMTKDQGIPRGVATSLLAILGMGTQVHDPERKHQLEPARQ